MTFQKRFLPTDELLKHLDEVVSGIDTPLLKGYYSGFLAVAGVTVYELAIKDIFYAFADKKHKILGVATRENFDKLNGQIKIDALKGQKISFFGDKYKKQFTDKLNEADRKSLLEDKRKISNDYGNLITWRNSFAHGCSIDVTFEEVKTAYNFGKEVIYCLNSAMVR